MEELIKLLSALKDGEGFTGSMGDLEDIDLTSEGVIEVITKYGQTKEGQTQLKQTALNKELGEISDIAGQVTGIIGSISDIKNSNEQIKIAKEGLQKLSKPQAPVVSPTDPALDREIYDSQMGQLDQSEAAASARAGFDDVYNRDMMRARGVSGGQAGAYGAMGQLASGRRNRAEIGLTPQLNTIRRAEQDRTRLLLNQREGQNARRFRNKQSLYNTGLNQYNTEARAAGNLMATGHANKRNAWRTMGNRISQMPTSLGGMMNFQGGQPGQSPRSKFPMDPDNFDIYEYEDILNSRIGLINNQGIAPDHGLSDEQIFNSF